MTWIDPLGLNDEYPFKFSKNFEKKLRKHARDIYTTSKDLGVPVAKGDKEGMKNFILSIVNDKNNLVNPNFKWNTLDSLSAYAKGDAVVLVNNKTNEIITFLHKGRLSTFLEAKIK